MCQLRSDKYTSMASRRHRSLSVQRLRFILQDERTESPTNQTKTKTELTKRGETGGHQLRKLQDDDDNPLAAKSEWRTRLQRLRTLLQTAQRE